MAAQFNVGVRERYEETGGKKKIATDLKKDDRGGIENALLPSVYAF